MKVNKIIVSTLTLVMLLGTVSAEIPRPEQPDEELDNWFNQHIENIREKIDAVFDENPTAIPKDVEVALS